MRNPCDCGCSWLLWAVVPPEPGVYAGSAGRGLPLRPVSSGQRRGRRSLPPKRSGVSVLVLRGNLEIGAHGKFELLDKYFFKGRKVVLFVKDEHGLFIIDGVHGAE